MIPRNPYVGEGVDGARRSAQIDSEELDTLDAADPSAELLRASALAWDLQADLQAALEAQELDQ